MQTQEKSDREWYEELVADSDYTLATNILKAIEKRDWEEAKTLAQKMIEECTIERKLELGDCLRDLLIHTILWTQSTEENKPGEWATATWRSRERITYLRYEQPSFTDNFIQSRIDSCFDFAKEMIMGMDITPFRIRKPTWEELFINEYSVFNQ
jgi:type II secretory pathway pseudopilin PulG